MGKHLSVAIFSLHSGHVERGVESWAACLASKIEYVKIISGEVNENPILNLMRTYSDWRHTNVLVPTNGRTQVFVCRILALFLRKRVIVFGHSGPGADDKWNLLCSPHIFVAFSKEQYKWAERNKLPWTKVELIHHAVDISRFGVKRNKKTKTVLCVAADTPDKRVHLVREAVGKLKGFRLLVVGRGGDTQVDFTKMPSVYSKADVFCFVPQPWEAFGLVFLEALSSNIPVVTSDDPVRREIVGNAGIFVSNPEDTDDLAKKIKVAYQTNWGDKPRRQAEKFSWDKIKNDYIRLFDSL